LPFVDGGRSTEGFGLFAAAAGITGLVALPAWRRPSLVEFAVGGVVFLAWAWLPWSPCPYAGFRAALYVTAAAILFIALPVVLADHRGRALLAAGLLAGILASLRHVYPQLYTEAGVPDHWVDPEFAGVLPFRVSGPMQNPNTFAAYMALSLPLLAGAALCCRRGIALVMSLAAAAATAGLILTFSRAAWLGDRLRSTHVPTAPGTPDTDPGCRPAMRAALRPGDGCPWHDCAFDGAGHPAAPALHVEGRRQHVARPTALRTGPRRV